MWRTGHFSGTPPLSPRLAPSPLLSLLPLGSSLQPLSSCCWFCVLTEVPGLGDSCVTLGGSFVSSGPGLSHLHVELLQFSRSCEVTELLAVEGLWKPPGRTKYGFWQQSQPEFESWLHHHHLTRNFSKVSSAVPWE